ncbi:MAG TPA: hypothetical protein PK580_10185 [Nitrosomonas halophila]|nr:hypothetical protein [Nitrosomonas halophila]
MQQLKGREGIGAAYHALSFRLDNLSTNAAWQAENNLENICRL